MRNVKVYIITFLTLACLLVPETCAQSHRFYQGAQRQRARQPGGYRYETGNEFGPKRATQRRTRPRGREAVLQAREERFQQRALARNQYPQTPVADEAFVEHAMIRRVWKDEPDKGAPARDSGGERWVYDLARFSYFADRFIMPLLVVEYGNIQAEDIPSRQKEYYRQYSSCCDSLLRDWRSYCFVALTKPLIKYTKPITKAQQLAEKRKFNARINALGLAAGRGKGVLTYHAKVKEIRKERADPGGWVERVNAWRELQRKAVSDIPQSVILRELGRPSDVVVISPTCERWEYYGSGFYYFTSGKLTAYDVGDPTRQEWAVAARKDIVARERESNARFERRVQRSTVLNIERQFLSSGMMPPDYWPGL